MNIKKNNNIGGDSMGDKNNRSTSKIYSSSELYIRILVICFIIYIFPESINDIIITITTTLMFNA